MNKARLVAVLLAAVVLGGCGYNKMYSQYAALQAQACGQDRQPLVQFVDSGGEPVTVYERSQECRIAPPDNPGRIAADTTKSVLGAVVKGFIGVAAVNELGETMRRGFDRAGDQIGRDGVIGGDNENVFSDATAPPPEPVIVESSGSPEPPDDD